MFPTPLVLSRKIKNRPASVTVFLTVALTVGPLYAAAPNPLEINANQWTSLDAYEPGTPVAAAANAKKAGDGGAIAAAPAPPAQIKPSIAAPTRSLNLPPMPAMNKGYGVQIDSTEDAKAATPITNIATDPDIELPPSNWQNAKEAAEQFKNDQDAGDGMSAPLAVRMSFLPNAQIKPGSRAQTEPKLSRVEIIKQQMLKARMQKAPPPKTPEQAAACAAVDAYKKQQLQAIQSDRQTLAALQAAIAQLGLQKQLSFMTDPNSSVGNPAGKTAQNISAGPSNVTVDAPGAKPTN